jgi:hypothetical protein
MSSIAKRYLQPGAILVALLLAGGCATTPAPTDGAVSIPQVYESVWYRDSLDRPGLGVMSDTGTLTVNSSSIEFVGGKEKKLIALPDIQSVSLKKLGSDFINNWIVIEYGAQDSPSYAVLSSGKALGWGGGTDQIFSTIDYVIKKNGLTTVRINK